MANPVHDFKTPDEEMESASEATAEELEARARDQALKMLPLLRAIRDWYDGMPIDHEQFEADVRQVLATIEEAG